MPYSFLAQIYSDSGAYSVRFSHVYGYYTYEDTIEEAIANAEEALGIHLEGYVEDGNPIPQPSGHLSAVRPGDIYAVITCKVDEDAARSAE